MGGQLRRQPNRESADMDLADGGDPTLRLNVRPPSALPGERVRWGSPSEFTALYETYLDTVYRTDGSQPGPGGRSRLVAAIAEELRSRKARRVLDCSAGTGFPALDLAADPPLPEFVIHCSDADRTMIEILADRIRRSYGPEYGIALDDLAPRVPAAGKRRGVDQLVLEWAELEHVGDTYDYVMCRGNSLVYATTWAGGRDVASAREVRSLLRMIAAKVRRGGYLHVDAPSRLEASCEEYTHRISADGGLAIWEKVVAEPDCRQWRLSFKFPSETIMFQRFSTLLTIEDVSGYLEQLGFVETEPRELTHERPGFGVIIARKPE